MNLGYEQKRQPTPQPRLKPMPQPAPWPRWLTLHGMLMSIELNECTFSEFVDYLIKCRGRNFDVDKELDELVDQTKSLTRKELKRWLLTDSPYRDVLCDD